MLELLNKTFWRFALGFVGILILGLGVFLIIGYAEYNSRNHDGADNSGRPTSEVGR